MPIALAHLPLIPAEAGIQRENADVAMSVSWVPAVAGTSG
jgi:hypothetical protein